MDDVYMLRALSPFLLTKLVFYTLLFAYPVYLVLIIASIFKKRSSVRRCGLLGAFACVTLLFCFLLELMDRLFRVFEIGMMIGLSTIDLSDWVRYYMHSQWPLMHILGLAYLYCLPFFLAKWLSLGASSESRCRTEP